MNKRKNNTFAVSEVMGTILLLGISVSLFSVIYISFFTVDVQPPTPTVDIMGTIHKNYLVLEHGGGEDIDAEFQIILRYNVGSSFVLTSDDIDGNFDGKWNIGEKLKFNLSDKLVDYTEFSPIDIMVVDAQSNSAVMMGTLKESPAPPEPQKYADVGIDDIYCTPNNVSENASEVTLYFEVKNYGDKTATGFNYTILIDGAEFVVDVSYDFSSQQNEESVTVPITLPDSYPQNMPSYNITVEISQYDSDGPDKDINNNIETTWVDFFEEEQYIPEADLAMIVKPVSEAPAYCFYDRFNFGVVVQNQGPDPINNVEVEISHNLVGTGIFWADQGTYNPNTGKWYIGNLNPSIQRNLKIDTFIEPMSSEVEFTQFAIVIDGSNTIAPDKFQMALQGIYNAIIDGSIPRNGQIELTIIQFGQTSTIPSYLTKVELPPTIINNNIGTPGYYQNIAEIVANIKKMGGQYSPFSNAIQHTTQVLKSSPNFNSNNVQIINFITDGQIFNLVPGGGHQCFEMEDGTIICIVDDIVYPEGSDPTLDLYLEAIQKRNEMISELGLTSDKDQINVLAIEGQQGLNLGWLQNSIVWPQPGYIWLPTSVLPGPGWLKVVDTSLNVRNCLGYQINYINIQARTVEAEIISYSGADDPDENNNFYSLTITPQKRKFA